MGNAEILGVLRLRFGIVTSVHDHSSSDAHGEYSGVGYDEVFSVHDS